MNNLLSRRLHFLESSDSLTLLAGGLRGIERETLRTQAQGELAKTPHIEALGSALMHPEITTDYSESLLEFITPAEQDIATALQRLDAIHRFTYGKIGDELLWSQSMPCALPDEQEIPIANYGKSHIGMLKHVYRQGLALRYGRTMQCIAGIHYNFSLSDKVWQLLQVFEKDNGSNKDFQSEAYIALIRNFHRYSWLLMYLFGASPAVDKGFLRGRPHQLETFSGDTLFLPYATSLRMSDLGYQNNAQSGLMRPYNTLFDYMKCLARAVRLPYPPYEALGLKRGDQWVQINTNILQVENEFYATIRPKRVINTGERPLEALCARGVQYIEVRCMDIDPFNSIGISEETSRFLDAFLLFCALDESPLTNEVRTHENQQNFALTVKEGRRPGLKLQRDNAAIDLRSWADHLLHQIEQTAQILDEIRGDKAHAMSMQQQKEKIDTPDLTPSFRVLDAIGQHQNSFIQFGLFQSKQHAQAFKQRPLNNADTLLFEQAAQHSLDAQAELEQKQTGDFDTFITDYRSRTPQHLCCENE